MGGPAPLVRFARDLAAHAGKGAFGLVGLLFAGAFVEGIGLILLIPLLSVVLDVAPGGGWLGEVSAWVVALSPGGSAFTRLLFLLGLFALLLGLRAVIILRRDVAVARLETGFIRAQRLRTIELLARTRWDVLARLRHGRVTHVLGGDMQACGVAAYLLLNCLISLTVLAGHLALALLMSPPLALLMLLVLAAGALALFPVLSRSRDLGAGLTRSNLGLVVSTTEFLGGLKLALSQNLQSSFLREFGDTLRTAAEKRVSFTRQRTMTQIALVSVASLVAGLVVLIGIGLLQASATTVIAFLFIMGRMNGPAAQIQNGVQTVFHSLPAYDQIKALQAELLAAQREPEAAPVIASAGGPVRFDNVSYWHESGEGEGESGGIFDLSLAIPEGEFLGVAGPSGAGKTTFADLLVGLYPPKEGSVTLAGRPLAGAVLAGWRDSIGYVSQDPFLFHDSVRRNLLWARPGALEDELWEALRAAGAEAIVRRLDGGLDAVLGERGALLSGGERQRIALARALIRRPRLLLLDEATSAIDLDGERLILESLTRALNRPTILMIAHRAESLAYCDRVIEFRNGRLTEAALVAKREAQ
jgi:ATP-binding cassette subfamily C protein